MSELVIDEWTDERRGAFLEFVRPLSNWGRWGADDELGTVNLLTEARIRSTTEAIRHGRRVALGRLVSTRWAPDNPEPLIHLMKSSGDAAAPRGSSHASDWFGLSYHGFAVTHVDAHGHQFFDGQLYNGRSAALVSTRSGAAAGSVEIFGGGIVGRGVLLDVPRASDRGWWDPGEAIRPADLDAAAASQSTTLFPGDLVIVRSGRDARAREKGVLNPMTDGSAGLAVDCLAWLREHDVAVLGSDAQSDAMSPGRSVHPMPIHVGALVFLGLPLLDNLWLEDLASVCEEFGQWEFQLTIAPLRLQRATGSPVNPIALL